MANIRWEKPLMQRWLLHWALRFLRHDSQESRRIKGVLDEENDRFSFEPCFLTKMGFMNYLCSGLKWSFLNKKSVCPSLAPKLGPFRGWGFLGLQFWAKVFGAYIDPLPYTNTLICFFNHLTILYHTYTHTLFHPNQTQLEVSVNQSWDAGTFLHYN